MAEVVLRTTQATYKIALNHPRIPVDREQIRIEEVDQEEVEDVVVVAEVVEDR